MKLHINEQGQVCTAINIYGVVEDKVLNEAQIANATAEGEKIIDNIDNLETEKETKLNIIEDLEQRLQSIREEVEVIDSQIEENNEHFSNYEVLFDMNLEDDSVNE